MTGIPLAQILTERLLNSTPAGMFVAGATWCLLRLIRRQTANTRFAIWFSTLLAIVALPFFERSRYSRSLVVASTHQHGGMVLSSSWAFCLFAAWALIAGLLLLRLSIGLWRLRRLRSDFIEVEPAGLDPEVAGILRDFGASNQVKLFTSNDVAVPSAIGFFSPAIIFPAWLLPRLSAEEIKAILPHELAHLRRGDPWTNLAQKIVKALFFFHPAVWWIDNRLMLEREMACDDVVLAQTASPKAYAQFLISFAEKLQNARGPELAQALLSRMHQLSLRVAQVLDAKRPSPAGFWNPVLQLSAGLLALIIGTAPYVPHLVAIRNQPRSQIQQVQTTKEETRLASAPGNASRAMAATVVHPPAIAKKVKAIPATYTMSTAVVASRPSAELPGKAMAMRAKATGGRTSGQGEAFIIVQSVHYSNSGPGIWTLCIWKIKGGTLAARQLESVIGLTI